VTTNIRKTALLGELVAAAFDGAARCCSDPREVSHLASAVVLRILRRARETTTVKLGGEEHLIMGEDDVLGNLEN
jgi:co-chaperonin GroES (HSP10)